MRKRNTFWLTRVAALALALSIVTACDDDATGPSLDDVDPQGTATAVEDVISSIVGSEQIQSYNSLGDYIGQALGAPAPVSFQFDEGATLTQALGTFARRLAACSLKEPTAVLAGPIIPDQLYATVFAWDVELEQYYAASQDGPLDGVRFLLYAIDPITGLPATDPLQEVGHVDFLDESVELQGNFLHVIVEPLTGAAVIDYTVGCALVTGGIEVSGEGSIVADGTTINLDMLFSVSQLGAVQIDFSLDVPAENLSISFVATASSFEAFDGVGTFTGSFIISRNNSIRFTLSVVNDVLNGSVEACDASNRCATVAVITDADMSEPPDPEITDSAGNPLNQDAVLALLILFDSAGQFVEHLFPMIAPAFDICFPIT